MNLHVVGFIPPVIGVEDEFNTFRLGVGQATISKIKRGIIWREE